MSQMPQKVNYKDARKASQMSQKVTQFTKVVYVTIDMNVAKSHLEICEQALQTSLNVTQFTYVTNSTNVTKSC